MACREMRSCSRPSLSSKASSAIAGTWRSSLRPSSSRCSVAAVSQDKWVVQPSWPSISLMNCVILEAAETACSFWMRNSAARWSRTVNQMSTRPLMTSAALVTATNRATYFQNSVRRTVSRSRHRRLPGVNLFEPIDHRATSRLVALTDRLDQGADRGNSAARHARVECSSRERSQSSGHVRYKPITDTIWSAP